MSNLRLIIFAGAVAASFAAMAASANARPATRSPAGVPPYCVLIGNGPRGATLPQICRFYLYQDCLRAASDLRGNCVANIDYRGPPPDTTGATWAKGARDGAW